MKTDTDAVMITTAPRVAGVQRGRLHNEWFDCPFSIEPATTPTRGHQRGFAWSAEFVATDAPERRTFAGVADTRALAYAAVIDTLTKYMSAVATERKKYMERMKVYNEISIAAGVSLPEDHPKRLGS